MNPKKFLRALRRLALAALGALPFSIAPLAPVAHAAPPPPVDPAIPRYQPRPFTVPKDAGYLRPDGSIFIAGASASTTAIANLNALFVQSHPGTKFTVHQPGSSAGPPAILFNLAAFAVINREILPEEVVPFEYMYKRKPIAIRVGHGSYNRKDYSAPMGVWVHPSNPLARLTTEQVARIFTVGGGTGDITAWGQVGLKGEWAARKIRVLGPRRHVGVAVHMRIERFGDYPFTERYEGLVSSEIGGRLAQDTSAIALCDFSYAPKEAKSVALSDTPGGYFSTGTYADVLAGKYPYKRYTYFYLNHEPGKPLDPFVKEYLRMTLSFEGQQARVNEENGFLPLSAKDVAEELRKLADLERPAR